MSRCEFAATFGSFLSICKHPSPPFSRQCDVLPPNGVNHADSRLHRSVTMHFRKILASGTQSPAMQNGLRTNGQKPGGLCFTPWADSLCRPGHGSAATIATTDFLFLHEGHRTLYPAAGLRGVRGRAVLDAGDRVDHAGSDPHRPRHRQRAVGADFLRNRDADPAVDHPDGHPVRADHRRRADADAR